MSEVQSTEEQLSDEQALIKSIEKDFASYTFDANFAVYLKFVHNRAEAESDIREDAYFPDFVHQFFVDSERIFGYKKPLLRIFYTAGRLKRYVKFDYEAKLTYEKHGIDADDVMRYLTPILEDLEHTQDLNQFIQEASSKEEQDFRPPGDLLCEYESNFKKSHHLSRAQKELLEEAGELGLNVNSNGNGPNSQSANGCSSKSALNGDAKASASSSHSPGTTVALKDPTASKKKYQIFYANNSTKGFDQYQARMQTLVMWFIESANMIDFQDPRWDCFMIFEKFNPSAGEDSDSVCVSTEDRYYFAGYATVYRYYAYPDKSRPRVSQMLIIPPYRRNGLGTTLLQAIYDYYKKQPATLDMTAEDPDEDFISMRDLLDCKNCLKLPIFEPDNLRGGWSEEMAKVAQKELKLCHRQTRKVYEILKLRITDKTDEEEYRNYRMEIKNRLNIPNQRQRIDIDRAMKRDPNVYVPEELKTQDRVVAAKLEDNYRLLEKQYQHIIDKLNQPKEDPASLKL